MEKVIISKSLKIDKELFDAITLLAKEDVRSVNSEILVLLREALENRKKDK